MQISGYFPMKTPHLLASMLHANACVWLGWRWPGPQLRPELQSAHRQERPWLLPPPTLQPRGATGHRDHVHRKCVAQSPLMPRWSLDAFVCRCCPLSVLGENSEFMVCYLICTGIITSVFSTMGFHGNRDATSSVIVYKSGVLSFVNYSTPCTWAELIPRFLCRFRLAWWGPSGQVLRPEEHDRRRAATVDWWPLPIRQARIPPAAGIWYGPWLARWQGHLVSTLPGIDGICSAQVASRTEVNRQCKNPDVHGQWPWKHSLTSKVNDPERKQPIFLCSCADLIFLYSTSTMIKTHMHVDLFCAYHLHVLRVFGGWELGLKWQYVPCQ